MSDEERRARNIARATAVRAAKRAQETPEETAQRRAIINAQQKALRDADPERFAAYRRKHYNLDVERSRARGRAAGQAAYAADPEGINARLREARAADPHKFRARQKAAYAASPARQKAAAAKRRALQLQATPAWSEAKLIVEFYAACPAGAEVDHWLPLQGETVCGLHVLANLQYLTRYGNVAKLNKMPHDQLPPFVAREWTRMMLARFYSATETEMAA